MRLDENLKLYWTRNPTVFTPEWAKARGMWERYRQIMGLPEGTASPTPPQSAPISAKPKRGCGCGSRGARPDRRNGRQAQSTQRANAVAAPASTPTVIPTGSIDAAVKQSGADTRTTHPT